VTQGLVLLDALLASPSVVWLATSEEKQVHLSSLAAITAAEVEHLTRFEDATKAARAVGDWMPIGIDLAGRWVFVYVVTGDQLQDFHWFLQRHAALFRMLPAWTLRVVYLPLTACLANCYDKTARNELAGLRPELLNHLHWYFARRRAYTLERAAIDDQERYDHAHYGFAATRFQVLYRRWLREGDIVFETISSGALGEMIASGAGRIECHVLPFSYRHLSPLVGESRLNSKGAEEGEDSPAPSRPPHGPSTTVITGSVEPAQEASV
jgi:hypothetical protein